LDFIGKHSYDLYLVEGKLIILCSRFGILKQPALYLLVYIVLLVVCAAILRYLLDLMSRAGIILR
jgi:peptidoglycan/LPS O-acetylase OafA/YrhL